MTFLGLSGARWLLLFDLALMFVLLLDAFQGHLRRKFYRWTQFLPFILGFAFMAGLVAIFFTDIRSIFDWLCALLFAGGIIGFGLHQIFGIAMKPGGYSWFRHYLMYGPTALAPLGLSAAAAIGYGAGQLAYAAGPSVAADGHRFIALALWLLLAGSLTQSLLLHFRGAFNNVAMYAPLTFPLIALVFLALLMNDEMPSDHGGFLFIATVVSLIGTAIVGFIGAGMHLRGFDRQMGGLNVALFNYLSGPPAFAPLVFSVGGGLGLVLLYLA
jgi:hypothetical protein